MILFRGIGQQIACNPSVAHYIEGSGFADSWFISLGDLAVRTTLAILSFVFAFPLGVSWGQVRYSVTDLTPAGAATCQAFAINNIGQVVGYMYANGDADSHGFLYSGGSLTDIGTAPGGWFRDAVAINDSGQIVGDVDYTTLGTEHACTRSDGSIQDLGTLGGLYSYGHDINASGQVVGHSYLSEDDHVGRAFLYSGGSMHYLGIAGGASGINDGGQVVGWVSVGNTDHAFLYSGGSMEDLGTLSGGTTSWGNAINNSGQVVGYSDGIGGIHAFLYSGSSMQDLGTLSGGTDSIAEGINNKGQVVGFSFLGDPNLGVRHAFLYSGGVMQDLNNLVLPNSGWTLVEANAINDSGQIVANGENPNGQFHAYLLTPTPEPSTIVLLGVGGIGLLGYAWRRRRRTAEGVSSSPLRP